MFFLTFSWPMAAILAGLALLYITIGVIYRLYLSPIAKVPGPKLAALTWWYESYYDVVLGGRYNWEIERMHQIYGPIVRINPVELHINDPEYYDVLYAGGSQKRDKTPRLALAFNIPSAAFATVDHHHHRLRRAALNPYFSKRSVIRLKPLLQAAVEKLCERLEEFKESGDVLNLGPAFTALTTDIITEYSFARSYNLLSTPDFTPEWLHVVESVGAAIHINQHFPWLLSMFKAMPASVGLKINPNIRSLITFQQDLEVQVKHILEGQNENHKVADHLTVIHELLHSNLGPEEKTLDRLRDEGIALVGAGTITTAHHLSTTTFHLLTNPNQLQKLKAELAAAIPDPRCPVPLGEPEQLPYLSAVVKEGHRMTHGVSHRLQRVSPDTPLVFHDWFIPKGTSVGMTSVFLHNDPTLFPEPTQFNPERWLSADEKGGKRLEKYLVHYGRGTRACLGNNLAQAEIYLTLAYVFRRFDFDLYDTTRRDVDIAHDNFVPQAAKDSKGVRVTVRPTNE